MKEMVDEVVKLSVKKLLEDFDKKGPYYKKLMKELERIYGGKED